MTSLTTLSHYHPLSSFKIHKQTHSLSLSLSRVPIRPLQFQFKPKPLSLSRSRFLLSQSLPRAYISGPASDPNVAEPDPKVDGLQQEEAVIPKVVTWELLGLLLFKHKFRIALCVASLFACTACTLSMPIFSGRFFEVLIGVRPEPLWSLLSKMGVLYALEPLFTVIFVINMNIVWEKVMSTLRAQIFGKILIQKVEFFDKYKVEEITGLLTSDLGSLKDLVSENVSRDRGFRALSEASNSRSMRSELYISHI
ncbi:putative peptide-transporting ATPase [Medicago truncatula]|uniref:Putative peptide-transporting ATPase n=1 Tax=Medicago truncatula TaxID=3880 RepID=A0A396HEY2_MEDTR|nr:putative peptide-transporting ATPase [Medicago truncatula]